MAKLDYKKMNLDDIEKWCIDNGEAAWLIAQLEDKGFTFIKMKTAFCKKFMPEIIPVAKVKVKKVDDTLARLRKHL